MQDYTVDSSDFSIGFEVDGVNCKVTSSALEDINPSSRNKGSGKRFEENRQCIEEIAREKISRKEFRDMQIIIFSAGVL